jgi:hypothetical protein
VAWAPAGVGCPAVDRRIARAVVPTGHRAQIAPLTSTAAEPAIRATDGLTC